jgi:hypothetical protein
MLPDWTFAESTVRGTADGTTLRAGDDVISLKIDQTRVVKAAKTTYSYDALNR